MARASTFRRLSDDWPVLFAGGVVLWFAATAFGATHVTLDRNETRSGDAVVSTGAGDRSSDSGSDTASTSASDSEVNPVITSGPFKIKVASFRLDADRKNLGTIDADVILEITNTTKQNVTFYPSQVMLEWPGETSAPYTAKQAVAVGVSPNLPVTAPLTFQVSPDRYTAYQLRYAGHILYSGLPF